MNNPKYQAIIRAGAESRATDFKGPMNWLTAAKCEKFEILKDIAAMANAGGGVLVIGRDGPPPYTTGTLDATQVESFDTTDVHKLLHNYLDPQIECRIEVEQVGSDLLVIIDVPEFDPTPLVFKSAGNCSDPICVKKNGPHFRPGDVYTRTKAAESRRISDATEMQDLLKLGIRKSSEYLVTEMQRMLSAPLSVEQPLPVSPYDEVLEREYQDFFRPRIFGGLTDTVGIFDMVVMPADYKADRLTLKRVPNDIREFAYVINRNGIFDSVPYERNTSGENFSNGSRLLLVKPEFREVEAVSLHTSGLYRVARVFAEDYETDKEHTKGTIVQNDRELWVDIFVEQMTMLHLLARNIARKLLTAPNEEVQVDLRVTGLIGRTLSANNPYEFSTPFHLFGAHKGTENSFRFPLRITLRELEVQAVNLARERCEKILWTFGLHNPPVSSLQRKLLGNAEPVALPPAT